MKRNMLIAIACLIAAPAFAQNAIGSVGVTYSNPSVEVAGDDVDADVWTVDGTVALPAADWTVTLNGAVDYTKAFGEEDVTGVAAAHLTKMWTSDVRAGAFVAANDIGSGNDPVWTVGAEAQKYLSNATLTGLVAYTTSDDSDADIWTVGGDAAFYVTDALRLNAGVSWLTIDDADADGFTYSAGAEYEIGLVQKGNRFIPLWDAWRAGGLQKITHENGMGGFLQAYATEKAKLEARRKGFQVRETKLPNGNIKLEVRVP